MEACSILAGGHAPHERVSKHGPDPCRDKPGVCLRKSCTFHTKASFNSAISACEAAREWEQACAILVWMKTLGQTPDEISYNSAISAAEKAGQWEHAVQLVATMSAEGTDPSTVSFNAAISACAKPGEWQVALALAAVMEKNGVSRDEITFNCISNACEKAGCWELALELLLQKTSPTKIGVMVYRICKEGDAALVEAPLMTPAEASQVVWRLAKLSRLGAAGLAGPAQRVASAVKAESFELRELSAVLWSLARLGADAPMQPLSRAVFRKIRSGGARGLNIRSIANLAWALSSVPGEEAARNLGLLQNELAERCVYLSAHSMSQASWTEFATAAFAILYAAYFAGLLLPNAAQAVRSALVRQGERMDAARSLGPLSSSPAEREASAEREPWARELGPGLLLIRKPPHWQVDERDAAYEAERFFDDRGLLSGFVQSMRPGRQCPILLQTGHQRGFLHRLDVPSSGLILAATSFEAFYDLKFQLATGLLTRAYTILCHGLLNPSRAGIRSPVNWLSFGPDSNRASLVEDSGRPSQTYIRSLARAFRGQRAFSLVAVEIMTGRRHQIRVHTSYVGHPTLTDGKYTATTTSVEDATWPLGIER